VPKSKKIQTNVPSDIDNYITDRSAKGWHADTVTDPGNVENVARNWGLPPHIVNKFRAAVFGSSLAFQSFQVTIPARVNDASSYASMDEVVGVARNNNGQVQMAYVWATSTGRLIGAFDTIEWKKCRKVLFVSKCKKKRAKIPRPFTADEINYITRGLRGRAYRQLKVESGQYLMNSVGSFSISDHAAHSVVKMTPVTGPGIVPLRLWTPPAIDNTSAEIGMQEFPFEHSEYLAVLDVDKKNPDNMTEEWDEVVNLSPTDPVVGWASLEDPNSEIDEEIKRNVEEAENVQDLGAAVSGITGSFGSIVGVLQMLKSESSSSLVNQFMGPDNGFKKLKQSVQVQRLTGMRPDYLPAFSDRLIQRLSFPPGRREDFINTLADIPFFDSQQTMSYDFMFDINQGGRCKYVSLLVERRPDDKINWLIADFVAGFDLAPNVFVIRKAKSIAGLWSTSKDTFKIVPRGITDADVEFIFKWMQLLSFKRFADLLQIAAPDPAGI